MPTFYSLQDAADLVGVSYSTIKRRHRSVIADDDHSDRYFYTPSVSDYADLKKQKQIFSWKISEDLLKRDYPAAFDQPTKRNSVREGTATAATSTDSPNGNFHDQTLHILKEQLESKDQQIAELFEQLSKKDSLVEKFGAMTAQLQERLIEAPAPKSPRSSDPATSRPSTVDADIEPATKAPTPKPPSKTRSAKSSESLADRYTPTFKKILTKKIW